MGYQEFLEKYNFQTGDIILYQHKYRWISAWDYLFNVIDYVIQVGTCSKYTHVAVVVKDPVWNKDLKGYYIIESNRENIPDAEDHKIKMGVELIPLEYVYSDSLKGNYLFHRKLHCVRDENFYNKWNDIHKVIHNKPYDILITDWIKALFKWNIGDTHKTNTFWCSALAAYIYCKLGFLEKDIDWTLVSPVEFSCKQKQLKFINCTLDDEVKLKK